MIETKDITKMVSHILRRDKGIADTQIMHPTREWFIGLGITTLIVIFGSWFCFYLYSYHTSEMEKEVVVVEQAVPYQATAVKNALELFAQKQATFDQILRGDTAQSVPVLQTASTTTVEQTSTSSIDVPVLIIDPPPVAEDPIEGDFQLAP